MFGALSASGTDLRAALLPFLAALLAQWAIGSGALACDGLADGPAGTVTAVPDGNRVVLDSGIAVRLIGTSAPIAAKGRAGAAPNPHAEAARVGLAALVMGKAVRLGLDAEETNRYGDMEAELFLDDAAGTWIQGALLAAGLVRVEPSPINERCTADMLAAEAVARTAGLGIWSDPDYSVRDANDPASLAGLAGRYELAEGRIVSVGTTPRRDYLDFGHVWKDDVTATIGAKTLRRFAAAGIDPASFRGKRIRVRGWVEDHDGPALEIESPAQIELLGAR
jgi:endonuclease YncB( thermonuclease family)